MPSWPSRCDPRFEPILAALDREALEAHPGSVVGLWSDYRIAYVNPAWSRFAEENAGQPRIGQAWGLGASYMEAVPGPLRPFFERLFERSLEMGATAIHPATLDYECSSAGVFRFYHMDVYGLARGRGHLIVNSLVVERPHDPEEREPRPPGPGPYVGPAGFVTQCAHCRRVENAAEARWDWVPDWVDHSPDMTSHAICPICFDYFYPEEAERESAE